jgi:hypothetical protein
MTALLTIFALILALPLQMAGFTKTLAHLQEHRLAKVVSDHEHDHRQQKSHSHDESHAHQHDHDSDTHEQPTSDIGSDSPFATEHSHGDDSSPHSHAKELTLTLLQYGSDRTEIVFEIKSCSTSFEPSFEVSSANSRQSFLSLLRPPIQA